MTLRLRWLGTALAAAGSIAFIGYAVSTVEFADMIPYLTARGLALLAASIALYSLIVPLAALAWQLLLTDLGCEARWSRLNAILLATLAGKYVPGNVAQHLGRLALSLSLGIPGAVVIASIAYELVLLLIADGITAVSASALAGGGSRLIGGATGVAVAGILVASIAALAAIALLGRLLPRIVKRVMPQARASNEELPVLRPHTIAKVIAIYVTAMLCVGASICVLALGLPGAGSPDFALLTAAFTIAWAVGFVTPGAPAGIGVREALLLLILGPTLGTETASLLILALRVATTLGDVLCFALGMALLARNRRRDKVAPISRVARASTELPEIAEPAVIGEALLGPSFPQEGWVPAPRYLMRRARIFELMDGRAPGRLLETGPGAGTLLIEFSRRGFECEGLESSEQARALANRLISASRLSAPVHPAAQLGWEGQFDYLFSFDVLEHIEDDKAALTDWASWLKPGGTLLLSVPARNKLWTAGDEWAGHFRRYEWAQLTGLLDDAGFEIEAFECYGFPLTNLSEQVTALAVKKSIHRQAVPGANDRKANNDRSGIEREPHLRAFPLLESLAGRSALRLAFAIQKLFLRKDWGSGYIVRARRRWPPENGLRSPQVMIASTCN